MASGCDRRSPFEELRAHLDWISSYIAGPRFRGCLFLNAVAEFPENDHPSRSVCHRHKAELRRRLTNLAVAAGLAEPDVLAKELILVIDGAFANSQVLGKRGPACRLRETGDVLIEMSRRA